MTDSQHKIPVGNPDYNLDLHKDNTTIKAIAAIYKVLGKNADKLAFPHDSDMKKINDDIEGVAQEIVEAIIENNVPDSDMQELMNNFQAAIQLLFTSVTKQKNGFERELLARVIGTRNPKEGTYSRPYATLGDMYAALIRVREEQGNNTYDYFNPNVSAPVPEDIDTPAPEAEAMTETE